MTPDPRSADPLDVTELVYSNTWSTPSRVQYRVINHRRPRLGLLGLLLAGLSGAVVGALAILGLLAATGALRTPAVASECAFPSCWPSQAVLARQAANPAAPRTAETTPRPLARDLSGESAVSARLSGAPLVAE